MAIGHLISSHSSLRIADLDHGETLIALVLTFDKHNLTVINVHKTNSFNFLVYISNIYHRSLQVYGFNNYWYDGTVIFSSLHNHYQIDRWAMARLSLFKQWEYNYLCTNSLLLIHYLLESYSIGNIASNGALIFSAAWVSFWSVDPCKTHQQSGSVFFPTSTLT